MMKLTISVKENKDGESCKVDLSPQKDTSKATKQEMLTANAIYSVINEALQKLEKR